MIDFDFTVKTDIPSTYRVDRVKSLFNVEEKHGAEHSIKIGVPIDEKEWKIGAIIGPSGSGKTTLGRRLLENGAYFEGFKWGDKPIIDELGKEKEFDKVTSALSSVGLGSVPSWLRPYKVLSGGEKFRAELAKILLDVESDIIIDEFTSVVDRQVAKIGSAAFAKAWRKKEKGRVVALSPHYDIIEWLQPDWVLDTEQWEFRWRCHRQRPEIKLDIFRTNWKPWGVFEKHHYLKLPRMIAATCYTGTVEGEAVAHCAVTTSVGQKSARIARFVVMPEWQGAGVGMKFIETIAQQWLDGDNRYKKRMTTTIATGHPALIKALKKSKQWKGLNGAIFGSKLAKTPAVKKTKTRSGRGNSTYGGDLRSTASFRYVG